MQYCLSPDEPGGRDVIVLERDYIRSGSTGKYPGGVSQRFSAEVNTMTSVENAKFPEHFEEEAGRPADFSQNVALQRQLGLEVYLLSPKRLKKWS